MKHWIILLFLLNLSRSIQAQITEINLSISPVGTIETQMVSASLGADGWTTVDRVNLIESTIYDISVNLGQDQSDIMTRSNEIQFFPSMEPDFISGAIEYLDSDNNQLPIGFLTRITLDCVQESSESLLNLLLSDFANNKTADIQPDQGDSLLLVSWPVQIGKDPDAPPCENEEEIITDVTLTWIPLSAGDTVRARAQDPDGEGPLSLEILDEIQLLESAEYRMEISVRNEIEGEDITEEIQEEADEHQFFFAFTDEAFHSPSGDGNIDNSLDPINYLDQDGNQLPLGLSTAWTTACLEANATGTFQIILKHQPDVKSSTSGVNDGSTDLDLIFDLLIRDQPDAPSCENEEEIITDVVLTWIPQSAGDTVRARAQDPDGEGPLSLEILDEIQLLESAEYRMEISVSNEIEGENITDEIREEAAEHQFFFAFTEGMFSDPAGDGNVDNRLDSIRYNDSDENGLPVGLSTLWTTNTEMSGGEFRLILKHQPDIKSNTSTSEDGGTDIDLTWKINSVVTSSKQFELLDPSKLVLAPNPVKDKLDLILDNSLLSRDAQISIYHVSGQLIQQIPNFKPSIGVRHLANGIYFIQYLTGNKLIVKKFVKD